MPKVFDQLLFPRLLNLVNVTGSRSLGTSFSNVGNNILFVYAVVRLTAVAATDLGQVGWQQPFGTTLYTPRVTGVAGESADMPIWGFTPEGTSYGIVNSSTGTGTAVLQTWFEIQLV